MFVLLKIIGLDPDDELVYQRAFLTEELNTLFESMKNHRKKASKYMKTSTEDELAELLETQATIKVEGPKYSYANVREYTGQSSVRDRSTYRPHHLERRGYYSRW